MDPDTAKELARKLNPTNWHAEKIDIDTEEDYLIRAAVKISNGRALDETASIKLPYSIKKLIGKVADFQDDIRVVTEETNGKHHLAFIIDDGEVVDTRPKAEQERAERLIEAVDNQYPEYTIGSKYGDSSQHRLIPHYTHLGDIITATKEELMDIDRIGETKAENIVNKHSQEVKQRVSSGIERRRFLIEDTSGTFRFPKEYNENNDLKPRIPVLKPEDVNPDASADN